jgi:hypothetical protein
MKSKTEQREDEQKPRNISRECNFNTSQMEPEVKPLRETGVAKSFIYTYRMWDGL